MKSSASLLITLACISSSAYAAEYPAEPQCVQEVSGYQRVISYYGNRGGSRRLIRIQAETACQERWTQTLELRGVTLSELESNRLQPIWTSKAERGAWMPKSDILLVNDAEFNGRKMPLLKLDFTRKRILGSGLEQHF